MCVCGDTTHVVLVENKPFAKKRTVSLKIRSPGPRMRTSPYTHTHTHTRTPVSTDTRVFRTRQELRSDRTGAELYGGGRVSEGRADVMESGRHSKELSIDLPAARTLTPQGRPGQTRVKSGAQIKACGQAISNPLGQTQMDESYRSLGGLGTTPRNSVSL